MNAVSKIREIKNAAKLLKAGVGFALAATRGRAAGRRYLVETLQNATGLHAKFAQVLKMNSNGLHNSESDGLNLIPPDFHKTDSLLSIDVVTEIIEQECPQLLTQIESFENGVWAASLGQVHCAKLKSGARIAIKVQYPFAQEELQIQFKAFMKLSSISPAKKFNFCFEGFSQFLAQHFTDETNYKHEALVQEIFCKNYCSFASTFGDNVVIPSVFTEFSTGKLLVQKFENVTPFSEVMSWSTSLRERCSQLFIESFLFSLFQNGHIHSDLNPGNWGFRKRCLAGSENIELVLFDFGSTLVIPEKNHLLALIRIVSDIKNRGDISPLAHFEALGFDLEKLKLISAQLPALCERLFMPLISDRVFMPAEWDLAGNFDRILGENKWWFRMAGPPWFFLFMRSVQGLCWALEKLNVPISVSDCWHKANAHLAVEASHLKFNTQTRNENFLGLPGFNKCAQYLCIRITEGGREKVNLSLPVRVVDEIEFYLPEEALQEIKSSGENILEIKSKIQKSGYLPQCVLNREINSRKFSVSLV